MVLQVRLFAILRERAGSERLQIEVPAEATVADALQAIAAESPPLADALQAMPVVMAVNRVYVDEGTRLAAGDELALIPPVSGGEAERPHVRVTAEPLSAERLCTEITTNHTGAIVTFQGTTRDVEKLDYEAYQPMAEERIAAILADALARHEIEGAAAEHRIGEVLLGEPSVVVAIAAAHRGPAFEAAHEVIDRIKSEAPIWKREVEGGREEWVEGTPPNS